ncbi:MAG TPA: hypothetical protein VGM25_00790 [Caulobacteraceae bacterium]|jgi:hypothetical protein
MRDLEGAEMKGATKTALALAAAMTLSGCNMVMTDKPMFTAADGSGAPPLHPGVWRNEKLGCDFDETQAQDKWPLCSDAQAGVGNSPFWQEVSGDPVLLQTPLALPGAKASETKYFYVAVRPLKLDPSGRVVAMKSWPVRCGPPPPLPALPAPAPTGAQRKPDGMTEAEWADLQAKLTKLRADSEKLQAQLNRVAPTKNPLPGLKMEKDTGACTPDSVASLRNAAKASEAWADEGAVSHWVRETGPGDKPPATPASLLNIAGGGFQPTPADTAAPGTAPAPASAGCGGITVPTDPSALSCSDR